MNEAAERGRLRWGAPQWVWALIAVLGALQPALHLYIRLAPPEGMQPTGLHTPDSAIFLHSMRMFTSDFYSPYAACDSILGDRAVAYFSLPHQWFYGIQGVAARIVHVDDFLFYGFVNGLATAIYLLVVYRLLRSAVPLLANRAFVLYTLGGGLGGAIYVIARIAGLHDAAEFETYFFRFALYELLEGEHLIPVTFYGRSYYLASLALCLGGLNAFLSAQRLSSRSHLMLAGVCLLAGAFLNARFGAFTMGIAVLVALTRYKQPASVVLKQTAAFIVAGVLGGTASWALMRMNPTVIQNHVDTGNMNLWLSPFLTAVAPLLLIVPKETWRRARRLPLWPRMLAMAGIGYLLAFGVLYAGYQLYWGNVLVARDAAVAIRISDWALLGAAAAVAWSLRDPAVKSEPAEDDWILLWMIGFLAITLSAWGQGWFLRFGPQRMVLMLYLPICIVAAGGLHRLAETKPRRAAYLLRATVACGVTSIIVSSFVFQAPLGRTPDSQAFDWTHTEVITEHDVELIARIPEGARVLAQKPVADVIGMMKDCMIVFGVGSFNLTDVRYIELERNVARFFTPDTDDALRRELAGQWCADYVYCADTWPVDEDVIQTLRDTAWLEEVAHSGRGALFAIRPES